MSLQQALSQLATLSACEIGTCHYLVLGITMLGQGLGAQYQDNVTVWDIGVMVPAA